MIAIIWVVLIVAVAIWQLSIAPGRTQLQGRPFEHEPATVKTAPLRQTKKQPIVEQFEESPPDVVVQDSEGLKRDAVDEASGLAADLMNAIVLSEVLAPPRAKQVRRQFRR